MNRKWNDMRLSVRVLIAGSSKVRFTFVQLCVLNIINIILHPFSRCQTVVFNGECLMILLSVCQ